MAVAKFGVRFGCGVAVAAIALCIAAPGAALAQAIDPLVSQALALQHDGKAQDAYALLAPHVGERAGDPDFDYVLGLAASDSGHLPEALLAFQRVLALQPNNAEARAEIARVYARMGDIESARAQFDTVLGDPSIPDPVRQRFTGIVRDLDKIRGGGGTDVTGFVEAVGGYDSNINAATDLTSITLPLFAFLGPASLSGAAVSQDSGFAGASAGLSVRTPVSAQDSLFASAIFNSRFNTRGGTFDQITAAGTAGAAHVLANRDVISLSGQYQRFWLGGDHYRTAYGAIGQYTFRLSGGRALSLGVNWYRLDYPTDPLRGADRYTATITYAGKRAAITASGGKEQVRNPAGANLSNTYASLNLGAELPVAEKLSVVLSGSAEGRWHDAADPLFLRTRRDVQLDASIGLKAAITGNLSLRPMVTYTRNFSNISLYDYHRVTASLALRAEF